MTPLNDLIKRIVSWLRHLAYRLSERWHDLYYGVATDGYLKPEEFGVDDHECHCYSATNYKRFNELMKSMSIRPGQDVFLDFGSGLGRVVILAATYPFKRVIGVELSKQLNDKASRNIEQARSKLTCSDIELQNIDARQYVVPSDVSVIYFWSPFGKEILRTVLVNIHRSYSAAPRDVTLLYTFAPGLSCLHDLLPELPWLKIKYERPLGSGLNVTICTIED